jgi:hypothetical protein
MPIGPIGRIEGRADASSLKKKDVCKGKIAYVRGIP